MYCYYLYEGLHVAAESGYPIRCATYYLTSFTCFCSPIKSAGRGCEKLTTFKIKFLSPLSGRPVLLPCQGPGPGRLCRPFCGQTGLALSQVPRALGSRRLRHLCSQRRVSGGERSGARPHCGRGTVQPGGARSSAQVSTRNRTCIVIGSVADPDPGSGAFLTPGSGIVFSGSRISDPVSWIPNPHF